MARPQPRFRGAAADTADPAAVTPLSWGWEAGRRVRTGTLAVGRTSVRGAPAPGPAPGCVEATSSLVPVVLPAVSLRCGAQGYFPKGDLGLKVYFPGAQPKTACKYYLSTHISFLQLTLQRAALCPVFAGNLAMVV